MPLPLSEKDAHVDSRGWLNIAQRLDSPNCDDRPLDEVVSLLVIHNISLPPGQFGSDCVPAFFCNRLDHSVHPFFQEIDGLKVSAHLFIDRLGHVIQFVSTSRRAWHAGVSCFAERQACNDFSIGIELEGTDDLPYSEAQYISLLSLTKALMYAYPHITTDRIVGHSDIASGRKTDPGPAFDWSRFRAAL